MGLIWDGFNDPSPAYYDPSEPEPERQHIVQTVPNGEGLYMISVDVSPVYRRTMWVNKAILEKIKSSGEIPSALQAQAEEEHLRREHNNHSWAKLYRDGWRRKPGK